MQIILLTTLFFFISTINANENCLLDNLASLARLNHKLDDLQGIKVNLTFNGETIHDGVFERKLDAGGVNYIIINDNGARRIVPVSSIDKIETTFFTRKTNPRDIQEQLHSAVEKTNDKNVGTSGDFITLAVLEREKNGKIERITTQIEVVDKHTFVIFDGSNRETISLLNPGLRLIRVATTKIDDFAIKRGLTTLEVNKTPRVNRDFRRQVEKLKAELRVSNYERNPSHEKFFNQGDIFFKDLSKKIIF